MNKKKLLFISGTRADFGKLKSLMRICDESDHFDVHIFATGMHMHHRYGYTVNEIEKSGFKQIFKFINYTSDASMDLTMAKTIEGLSSYIKEDRPDMIIVHGDRVETLAGAIVGSLNNILVSHIEGGEVSGTIDELIRHSVSKMSHIHFVSNSEANTRLIQMGESATSIFAIGSPDIDIMKCDTLPDLETVKKYYNITFEKYAIFMFHPVTTDESIMEHAAKNCVEAMIRSKENYIVIYPNNDLGSGYVLRALEILKDNKNIRIFPSLRFEYFLVLLKNCDFILGNSSAGIREAPHYGVPTVNIGNRQQRRALNAEIIHCDYTIESINAGIVSAKKMGRYVSRFLFGDGNSAENFLKEISKPEFWNTPKQKVFNDH